MAFDVLDWELNPQDMIHGGITYTLTTVNLSTTFLAPIRLGDTMFFHSKIKSFGRSLVTVEGEVFVKSTGKLAATATGTFKIMHHKVKEERTEEQK